VVTEPFLRVKVGVGRPPAGWNPADYVLGSWTESEKAGLDTALNTAADAVESLLKDGLERTMNFFNPEPAARNPRAAVRN
jgi:PTH1 family peptidyl-tRNA hydrolase